MTDGNPWTHCYTLASRDRRMNLEHFRFIEATLVELVEACGAYAARNLSQPNVTDLDERDRAIAELYLEEAIRVLRYFNIDLGEFTALSIRHSANEQDPADTVDGRTEQEALLRQISRAIGLEVSSFVRRAGNPNRVTFETQRVSFTVHDLQNHRRFRQQCVDATGHLVPHITRRRWDTIGQATYDACPQPIGPAGSADEMRSWITQYLTGNTPGESWNSQHPQRPFRKDGNVHLILADLRTWLYWNHGLHTNEKDLARRLRGVGWQPISVAAKSANGDRVTVRTWSPMAAA